MKNKKILKRIAAPLLCVVLSFCVCSFPVSAASDWHTYHAVFNDVVTDKSLSYSDGNVSSSISPAFTLDYGAAWNISNIEQMYYADVTLDNFSIDLAAGDMFTFACTPLVWFYGANGIEVVTGSVKLDVFLYLKTATSNSRVNIFSSTQDLEKQGNYYGRSQFTVESSFESPVAGSLWYVRIGITPIDLVYKNASSGQLRLYFSGGFDFGYGNPNAPGAPAYPTPEDGDLGRLESTEQELENNTAEGQQELGNIISSQSLTDTLLSYAAGLQMTSKIMFSAITRIPFLNALIWVAMSLGFVASLLGLAGAIVSAADRRAGRDARRSKGGSR